MCIVIFQCQAAAATREEAAVLLFGMQEQEARLRTRNEELSSAFEEQTALRSRAAHSLEEQETALREAEEAKLSAQAQILATRAERDRMGGEATLAETLARETARGAAQSSRSGARLRGEIAALERGAADERAALASLAEQQRVLRSIIDLHTSALDEQATLRRSVLERRSRLQLEAAAVRRTGRRLRAEQRRLQGLARARRGAQAAVDRRTTEVAGRADQVRAEIGGHQSELLALQAALDEQERTHGLLQEQSRQLEAARAESEREAEGSRRQRSKYERAVAMVVEAAEKRRQERIAWARAAAADTRATQKAGAEGVVLELRLREAAQRRGERHAEREAIRQQAAAVQLQTLLEAKQCELVQGRAAHHRRQIQKITQVGVEMIVTRPEGYPEVSICLQRQQPCLSPLLPSKFSAGFHMQAQPRARSTGQKAGRTGGAPGREGGGD